MPLARRTLLASALALPAVAQPARFPNQPIRMIVPWPAGGSSDLSMRAICEAAGKRLGQTMVTDNRPGAAGTLGAVHLATQARPDGYTLSQMPITTLRIPYMTKPKPFDALADFTWVAQLTGYTFGVVVRADAPWQDFRALLDWAKAHPGQLTYGTPGAGTSLHIAMEQIAAKAGAQLLHVPFRGSAETTAALLSGTVMAVADSSSWAPLVEDGKFRLLCVWNATRARRFPNVPTLRETGVDMVSVSPFGVAGPRGMEPAIVATLEGAFREAMADPAVIAVLDRFDMLPAFLPAEAYAAEIRRMDAEEHEMLRRLGLAS